MVYKVSSDGQSFEIEQKIATSVTLKAIGGVSQELVIKKVID